MKKPAAQSTLAIAALFGLALSAQPACSTSTLPTATKKAVTCAPNAMLECTCDGGATGSMVCNGTGTALSACYCPMTKCDELKATCLKCLDAQTQEGCMSVVNEGNQDACDSENQLLSSFCK